MTDETDQGSGKTERLHMFISPTEIAAIEDWRYKNRVQSKSEAVRRLCQIGLAFDREKRSAKELTHQALAATTSGVRAMLQAAGPCEEDQDGTLRRIAATIMEGVNAQLSLYQRMVATDAITRIMSDDEGELAEILKEVSRINATLGLEQDGERADFFDIEQLAGVRSDER